MDHPYITLSDNFIDAVEDARRDFKYQALIGKFGTHYPYAVTYGAAAKMTQSFSEQSYSKRAREERSFKAEAGASVFGVGGSVHFSNMKGRETGESGSMGSEGATFVSAGGNGSWDQNGYTVKAQNLPSVGVWLGSIDGRNNRFGGAIAGMRIWDAVIEQKDLVRYALRDIFDSDHPNLDRLSAMSDFAHGELLLVVRP